MFPKASAPLFRGPSEAEAGRRQRICPSFPEECFSTSSSASAEPRTVSLLWKVPALRNQNIIKLNVVGNTSVLIQGRFLAAARPKENSLGSGGYLDVVVPFPVGRAETMQEKTIIPKMPLCYGGRRGQSAYRAPPPSGWATCQSVCKHARSLSWGGRRRRWPSGEVPGAASWVRSAIPEPVRVPVTVASGKRTVRRRRRQSEPYPLLPRGGGRAWPAEEGEGREGVGPGRPVCRDG